MPASLSETASHDKRPSPYAILCHTVAGKQSIIYQKKPVVPAPQITERDLHLFHTLSAACYLTTKQIQSLFWPASNAVGGKQGLLKSCQERMRRLTAHGYTRRILPFIRRGDARQPYIYSLDKRGAERLSGESGIELNHIHWRAKNAEDNPSYLRHFLTTNDIRIAVSLACERNGATPGDWFSDKELKSGGMKDYVTLTGPSGVKQRAAVVPDACFTLSWGNKSATFFLELDLGTVTIRPSLWERRGWTRKINAYRAYLGSDACQKRYGVQDAQVLTITTTDSRREHLQEATQKAGAGMAFWFTTLAHATDPDKLLTTPIWHRIGATEQFSLLG